MKPWETTATRPGFCLGCGQDVGPVDVVYSVYGALPDTFVSVPSWCLKPGCVRARTKFDETADRILRDYGK